jgi:cytochrome b6-f complex subunit 7
MMRFVKRVKQMGGEILNTGVLSFGLVMVGLAVGFLLLKIQGGEEA